MIMQIENAGENIPYFNTLKEVNITEEYIMRLAEKRGFIVTKIFETTPSLGLHNVTKFWVEGDYNEYGRFIDYDNRSEPQGRWVGTKGMTVLISPDTGRVYVEYTGTGRFDNHEARSKAAELLEQICHSRQVNRFI